LAKEGQREAPFFFGGAFSGSVEPPASRPLSFPFRYAVPHFLFQKSFQGDPFDFVAAYLIPEDIWYIIPAEKLQGQGSIGLYPRLKKSKYGRYEEAWHLLRGCAETIERISWGDSEGGGDLGLRSKSPLSGV
jgi:hypothetical protein